MLARVKFLIILYANGIIRLHEQISADAVFHGDESEHIDFGEIDDENNRFLRKRDRERQGFDPAYLYSHKVLDDLRPFSKPLNAQNIQYVVLGTKTLYFIVERVLIRN
jgi:hypothetical protein